MDPLLLLLLLLLNPHTFHPHIREVHKKYYIPTYSES
jgi:hypothetical protein